MLGGTGVDSRQDNLSAQAEGAARQLAKNPSHVDDSSSASHPRHSAADDDGEGDSDLASARTYCPAVTLGYPRRILENFATD